MKQIVLIVFLFIFTNFLFSDLHVTCTMDSLLISQIRDAVDDSNGTQDDVIKFYYDTLNPNSDRYEEESLDWREERADYTPMDAGSYFAKKILIRNN